MTKQPFTDSKAAELAAFYAGTTPATVVTPVIPAATVAPAGAVAGTWQDFEMRGVPYGAWPAAAQERFLADQETGAANVVTALPQTDVAALKAEVLARNGITPEQMAVPAQPQSHSYTSLQANGIPFLNWPAEAQVAYLEDQANGVAPAAAAAPMTVPVAAAPAQSVTITYTPTEGSDYAAVLNGLSKEIHEANIAAGWWTDLKSGETLLGKDEHGRDRRNVGELLCLVHSEVSEAMEGYRKNLMDDKLPHRSMLEVELADVIIRICDIAGAHGLDLGGAIAEKRSFNANRADHKVENRLKDDGKKF